MLLTSSKYASAEKLQQKWANPFTRVRLYAEIDSASFTFDLPIVDRDCVSRVKLMTQNSSLICNNNNFDVKPLRKYFSVNFFVCVNLLIQHFIIWWTRIDTSSHFYNTLPSNNHKFVGCIAV